MEMETNLLANPVALSVAPSLEMYLLDSKEFSNNQPSQLNPGLPVSPDVIAILLSKNIYYICDEFFAGSHSLLPIFSRKCIYRELDLFDAASSFTLALRVLATAIVNEMVSKGIDPLKISLYL